MGAAACHLCGGSGITHRWRADAYGPAAFHAQVCACRLLGTAWKARRRRALRARKRRELPEVRP